VSVVIGFGTWMTGVRDPGHVAVLLGFVLSMASLAVGMAGTATWLRKQGITRLLIPAGALVVLALPRSGISAPPAWKRHWCSAGWARAGICCAGSLQAPDSPGCV
jgi:hypothetical protein